MTTYYGLEEGEEYRPWLWPVPEDGVIGKRGLRRKDGYEKASGKAIFSRDIYRPGMLYGKFLESPYAHAKIQSMDTSKAEALPGVRAVLRYDDPEIDWNVPTAASMVGWWPQSNYTGFYINILPGTANYVGEPIGAVVVADSEFICDRALKLIEIEWEELPFILDWNEALKPGAAILRPEINPDNNLTPWGETVEEHGDVEAGFKEADNIIEFTVNKSEEDVWAGVEALCTVAEWAGDYLDVWPKSQHPEVLKQCMAVHTPMSKLRYFVVYQGGSYDSVTARPNGDSGSFSAFAVIAAKRTQRPVKMLYDGAHFWGAGESLGEYKFKVGYNDDGEITAVKEECLASGELCDQLIKIHHGSKIHNLYRLDTKMFLSRGPRICYKHGAPALVVQTQVFDRVAGELGMDPTEVALKNDGCEGISMGDMADIKAEQGFDPTRDSLREVLEAGKKAIDWENKWHLPGTKKLPNGKYHGIGFVWCHSWCQNPGACYIGLRVCNEGTVRIIGQRADGGVATSTTYCQAVASEVGMKYEDVELRPFDDSGFHLSMMGGAGGLLRTLPTMVRASRKLKQLILEHAVKVGPFGQPPIYPDKTPEELDIKNSEIFEKANPANNTTIKDLVKAFIGFESTMSPSGTNPFFTWDQAPRSWEWQYALARQCYFMEVEVDTETGQTQVKKLVSVYDAGKVVNFEACEGQLYGGNYMGVGRSRDEAVYYDPMTGVPLNNNLIGYPVNLMNDVGPIDPILVETGLSYGPYGTCGIGEPPNAVVTQLTGPAIYNAIGVWMDDYPTTPDKVLKALGKA